jgi:hypothetical protein
MNRPEVRQPRPLTDRQGQFVELYTSGPRGVQLNATRAAEAAGYAWPGKQGPRLLTFPGVAERVETLFFERLIAPDGPEAVELYR